jgi:hypothetical protein
MSYTFFTDAFIRLRVSLFLNVSENFYQEMMLHFSPYPSAFFSQAPTDQYLAEDKRGGAFAVFQSSPWALLFSPLLDPINPGHFNCLRSPKSLLSAGRTPGSA